MLKLGSGGSARLTALVAAFVACLLLSSPLAAQAVPAPPNPMNVDENGVNLLNGKIVMAGTDVSIGPDDEHGLHLGRQYVNTGWRLKEVPTISGSATSPIVSFNGKSYPFHIVGSTFVPDFPDGSTLNTPITQFVSPDGTVIDFGNASNTYIMFDLYYGIGGVGTKVTWPDGTVWTYTYTISGFSSGSIHNMMRLSSINNSAGYQIKLAYASNTASLATLDAWNTITKATAINNAVEYCDPAANSCSPTNTWPEATYTIGSGSTQFTGVTDPESRTTGYTYTSGALTGVRAPGASADTITYGLTSGKVTSVTKLGSTWNYTYNSTNTVFTDPLANATTFNYNTTGQITSFVAGGQTTSYTYCVAADTDCPVGLLKKTTLPEGNYVQNTYDARGNLKTVTRVEKTGPGVSNIVTSAAYPPTCTYRKTCNLPTSTTDAKSQVTNYGYDNSTGALTSVTLPADTAGTRPETRLSYSNVYARYKNSSGTLVQAATSISMLTGVSKCRTGTVASSCVGTGDEQVTAIAYPSGTIASNVQPISVTTKLGDNTLAATTAITYNNFGKMLTADGPLSGTADTTRIRYTAHGQVEGTIGPDPDDSGTAKLPAVKYTYDSWGHPYLVKSGTVNSLSDADWASFTEVSRSTTEYDSYGRPKRQRAGSSTTDYAVSDIVYGSMGRVSCTVQRMDPSQWSAAASCTAPQTTGANGPDRVTYNETFDALGRVTKVTTANGTGAAKSEYVTFTNNGQVATVKDGENNLTTYEYDGHDRLAKTKYPSSTKGAGTSSTTDYEQVTYDANGNVTTFRTRRGEILTLAYDNLNRLITKDVPPRSGLNATHTRDVYFGYDLFGDMTYARFDTAAGEGITNTFNALGELTGATTNMDSTSRALTYLYDVAGNLTRITHPDSNYAGYNYSGSGALATIDLNGTSPLTDFDLDSAGRLSSLKRYNTASSTFAESSSATYDAVSRLATLALDPASTSSDASTTFTYNPASQIASAARNNDAYAWNGQAVLSRPYSSNGLNAYSAVAGTSFTYDTNGNLTSDGANTYVYDVENRLVTRSGGGSATLRYDPLGRLYEVVSGANTTRFLYSDDELVVEYDGSGTLLRRYIHALGGGDDPLVWFEGNGVTNSARRYLYADERGSIVAITDSAGAVIGGGLNSYDEYGIPGTNNSGRFQYTGQAWLTELGMNYYKARVYSPSLGRFMQTDPIGYGDGTNLYVYAHGDPLNGTDPTGTTICVLEYCGGYHPRFGDVPSGSGSAAAGHDSAEPWTNDMACFFLQLACSDTPAKPRKPTKPNAPCGVSAKSIDDYLKSKHSPMAGSGGSILAAGAVHNIDPRLLVAIAGAETTFGQNITRGDNNAWNWGHMSPSSFGVGAEKVASGLVRLYGLPHADFNVGYLNKYCTTGSTCGEGMKNIKDFMAEQGGRMDALQFPCAKNWMEGL